MMRAARYYGKEDIRIEDIPTVPCKPNQIKIQPAFVGLCGTDLHEYLGGPNFAPTCPHPCTHETVPVGMGHEFSGTIKEVGSDVPNKDRYTIGQKVAIQPTIYCGECESCLSGVENTCPKGGFIGLSGGGGGLSEEVNVPASAVHPLPDHIGLDIGALVEPISVSWHGVRASPLRDIGPENASCLIMGGGPVGLAVVQVLAALGTKTIIMSEVAAQRQQFARDFGAHHVLDPRSDDVVAKMRELCGHGGVDIVFDCAGVPASISTACKAIRPRGTVVNLAIWEKPIPFDPNVLVHNEGKYIAVLGYQKADFEEVIQALDEGRLKPQNMITGRIKIDDLIEKGILPLVKEKDKHVKILVDLQSS